MLAARFPAGVKVAVLPLTLTVPMTAGPPRVGARVKLAVVSDALVMASEKVAEIEVLSDTFVALFTGLMADTVGGVMSGPPVVKRQTKGAASALPAKSRTTVLMVAVYWVFAARFAAGAKLEIGRASCRERV